MLIVDSDAHYLDDYRNFLPYIDEPIRTQIARFTPQHILPSSTGDRNVSGRIKRPAGSGDNDKMKGADVPGIMEYLGVDIAVELPQTLLNLASVGRRDIAYGLTRGFVKYMLDQVVDPKRGVYTMVVAPQQVPKKAAQLIYEVGENAGICAVCLINGDSEPPLGDPVYDPIYRAAQEVGLPVVFHSTTYGIDEFPIRGFQKFLEAHTLGFLFFNMVTLVSVVVQGLPERFPGLKFAFQESGIAYVPLMMMRLDSSYKKRRSEAPLLKKLPSEYIRDFYFGTQPLEEADTPEQLDLLKDICRNIDAPNRLIFATDYPHWDYNTVSAIKQLPFLSKQDRARILGGNALDFFRFNDYQKSSNGRAASGKIPAGTLEPVS